ncbi:unnamed protein product [Mytilus edulis]|uniref:Uncharacterized protein n=1 Tax=Mytilus edulis TaxID=6550 RepID=A0A8S3SM59_MYTED|nr:unnamed protein product [Mytilus edulis]
MKQLVEPQIIHLIKIASQDFINKLCVMSINDTGDMFYPEYERYGVMISGDIIQVYIERVFDGLACSENVDEYLQRNRNITNTIFHTRLLDYMLQLDEQKIQYLIKTASQDFIERLCVMSIDDIKDDSVVEYERYGVIIPQDSLWLYIVRWLDRMRRLDDTEEYVERNRNRKTKLFTTSLCTFMEQLQEDVIEELIQTGSSDFLHKWFVTEGVKDNSRKGYEQYGIILKDKNLQKYNRGF